VTETPGSLREPLLAFAAATLAAVGLTLVGVLVPFTRDYVQAAIAVVFFYAPALAARRARRDFDYRDVGLRADPVGLNAAVLAGAVALTFPPFIVGVFQFYDRACAMHLGPVSRWLAPYCGSWLGFSGGHLQLPDRFALQALSALVVTAIPEEIFFRGYLMERLERVWPPRRRLAGAKVGLALIVSSALFAVAHFAVIPNPLRLAVFFPSLLFGWMWSRTKSIAVGALYHALCNILMLVVQASYFR
jgi:membrane protease YdiL (CAAX protease family)